MRPFNERNKLPSPLARVRGIGSIAVPDEMTRIEVFTMEMLPNDLRDLKRR